MEDTEDPIDYCPGPLRGYLVGATKALRSILREAHEIRRDREHGCERCAPCTRRILDILLTWHHESMQHGKEEIRVNWNPDLLMTKLSHFASFPHMLLGVLGICLETAKARVRDAESLIPKLSCLCLEAHDFLKQGHVLQFARLATVLMKVRTEAESIAQEWKLAIEELSSDLDGIEAAAHALEASLHQDIVANFREERYNPSATRARRLCGGGSIQLGRPGQTVVSGPCPVVDYARFSVLCLVNEPFDGERYQGEYVGQYMPCARELPFRVNAVLVSTDRGLGPRYMHDVTDAALRRCGSYFQVFKLTKVEPAYYYSAMCKHLLSNRKDNEGRRLVDRYDWVGAGVSIPGS